MTQRRDKAFKAAELIVAEMNLFDTHDLTVEIDGQAKVGEADEYCNENTLRTVNTIAACIRRVYRRERKAG